MIDTLKERPISPVSERVTTTVGTDEERVTAALATFGKTDALSASAWLRAIRESARKKAGELGFPTTNDEEWRFTNVSPVLQLPLHPAAPDRERVTRKDVERFGFGLDSYRLVFVNGHFSQDLSLLPAAGTDFQMGSLAAQLKSGSAELEKHLTRHAHYDDNFFAALNTAFFQDGAYVFVAADKTVPKPVHLLFIGAGSETGATVFPRSLIIAQRGVHVKIVESHVSLSDLPVVSAAVTELVLGAEAEIEHCKVQQESERAFHIATVQAVQEKDSRWTSHSIATGARLARNNVQTLFGASGASAVLNGLYLGHADQLIDHHTVVDHAQPRCESHEFYHGILADRAHGVFNGKIFVRQDAQKTNAKQTNRNLLLSDNAVMDTKPQLEIYADDVKCTHGAAIGQLSDEAIFYLRARGIGVDLARRMLIQAFASDVIERIGIEPVRVELAKMLGERFQST